MADNTYAQLSTQSEEQIAQDQTPQYIDTIGSLESNQTFTEFLFVHDGQMVNLDVVISEKFQDHSAGEDWLALWTDCSADLPAGEPASGRYCTGVSINALTGETGAVLLTEFGDGQALRGYWQVRANPGMHQGLLSISLLAVP